MHKKQLELKGIYVVLAALFLVFLFMPVAMLLYKSFESGTSLTLQHYRDLIFSGKFVNAFGNSFTVSGISALVTTLLAFLMAYTINYTKGNPQYCHSADALAYDHLWLCHYIYIWKAGTAE